MCLTIPMVVVEKNSYGQRGNGERALSIAPVWAQGIN